MPRNNIKELLCGYMHDDLTTTIIIAMHISEEFQLFILIFKYYNKYGKRAVLLP